VVNVAYITEYGLEIAQQSCLNFLLFIHADRRSKFHPFGVFSDERFHVREGNEAITDGLAGRLPGEIHFGHVLVGVRRQSDGRIRLAFDAGGRTVKSDWDAVVLAIPFSMLREVALDENLGLPPGKRHAIDHLAYGTNSKMMIGFDGRPWFTLHGSDGSSFSDLPNHQNTWGSNPTRATAPAAILTDYSGGARGASLDPGRVAAEAALFLADLEKIYPGAGAFVARDERGEPLRVHLENWMLNPLSRGELDLQPARLLHHHRWPRGAASGQPLLRGRAHELVLRAAGFHGGRGALRAACGRRGVPVPAGMIGCPNGDEMPARTGAMIPQSTYLSSGLVSAPDPQNYFAAIPRGSEEVGIDALSFSPDTAAKDTRSERRCGTTVYISILIQPEETLSLISARPESGSMNFRRYTGLSVRTTSHVGGMWALSR
jgi:Flavin containing amine oxidoreductase